MVENNELTGGYYCDELTAVPFRVLTRGLSQSMPVSLAFPMSLFIRSRGLMRWYFKPLYAMKGVSDTKWVTADQLSPRAWSKWAPYLEQLRDLQFTPIAHRLPDVIGAREQCSVLFLHVEGKIVASLEWMRTPGANGPQEEVTLELNSYGDQDPDILTGVLNPAHLVFADMLELSFVDSSFMSNATPLHVLFEKHKRRIGRRPLHCFDSQSAQAEHLSRAKRRFEWMLGRGLIRQLSPKEVAAVRMNSLKS